MKPIMTVVNNGIYAEYIGNKVRVSVKDLKDKRNKGKYAIFIADGLRVRVETSDYSINRTNDMLQDVKNNLRFILEAM